VVTSRQAQDLIQLGDALLRGLAEEVVDGISGTLTIAGKKTPFGIQIDLLEKEDDVDFNDKSKAGRGTKGR
jgi:hypothetical protein